MFNFSVDVFKLPNPLGKLVGFAKIIIEDALVLDGFKIFDGSKGLFLSPPSREGKDKEGNKSYFDQIIFLTGEDAPAKETAMQIKKEFEEAVIAAYNQKSGAREPKKTKEEPKSDGKNKRLW